MNTKLYCTTTLMMSMMKASTNSEGGVSRKEDGGNANGGGSGENGHNENENGGENNATVHSLYDPTKPKQPELNPVGYTIGATNVLFKQRLYDDLDAFIDEADIDFKNNEVLKKQLQLTTADLRCVVFYSVDILKRIIGLKLNF